MNLWFLVPVFSAIVLLAFLLLVAWLARAGYPHMLVKARTKAGSFELHLSQSAEPLNRTETEPEKRAHGIET